MGVYKTYASDKETWYNLHTWFVLPRLREGMIRTAEVYNSFYFPSLPAQSCCVGIISSCDTVFPCLV